jgi:hypothetical protein
MIRPVPGITFIIEDVEDGLTQEARDMGLVSATQRNVGVTGKVYATNDEEAFPVGCRVIFSKFVAEQICIKDAEGHDIKNLRSVPTEAILGFID